MSFQQGAHGPGPVPFRDFVLKTHSRCNLACTYCYEYSLADQSWRQQPLWMAPETVDRVAQRIAEHASAHELDGVRVVLHGGEPLLRGVAPLADTVAAVRRALPAATRLDAVVQTNGALLTEPVLDALAEARIGVGVSLDGGLARHNTQRIRRDGRPAWPAVRRGLELLRGRPEIYGGILSVVDLRHDPVEVFDSLAELTPPTLDFLLPHANWDQPPMSPGLARIPAAPYGEWLCRAFDRFWGAGADRPRVRLFEEAAALLLGYEGRSEQLGLSPVAVVVVAADGSIEQADTLKSAFAGAGTTGLDVFRSSFDEALEHPGIRARQSGFEALGPVCRKCPLGRVCGGGHYAHRYRTGSGFANPSVYCRDLELLLRHVAGVLDRSAAGVA